MDLPFKVVGNHRSFPVKGNSMPPLKDGSIMIGRYVKSLTDIKEGETYIVLTKDKEIVHTRIYRGENKQENIFEFHYDNPQYAPCLVKSENISEIWSFVCSLNIGEFKPQEVNIENVIKFLRSYHVEIG